MFAGQFSPGSGMVSEAKITTILIISCVVASTGGFMFGYDIGVTGGVTSMGSFLNKFFPGVYRKNMTIAGENSNNYCKQDDKRLTLFASSTYLAGLTATVFASYTTRKFGRKFTMSVAGVFFIVGVILCTTGQNLAMIIIGRILFGFGFGFANQAVPIYLSEISPTRKRGTLNILFQLNVTIGILFGNVVNYGTSKIEGDWGWRLSVGLVGIPATIFTLGSFFIVETPSSLIERGHLEKAKDVLRKIRGTNTYNIEPELLQLVEASRISKQVKKQCPFGNLLVRRNRPQLFIAVALQIFQQLSGIDAIMFYVPVLLKTIGYGSEASLYSAVIAGSFNVISTVISMYFVDKIGRKKLLLESGVHMFSSHVLMSIVLGIKVKDTYDNLTHGFAIFVVILVCSFVVSYAWSWGPLGWLIPSEIFPLQTRPVGQSIAVSANFLFTFAVTNAFPVMLCRFKFGIFLFYSGWIIVMFFFVFFFLPETKNIPIEDMTERVWKRHWFWKRFFDHHEEEEPIDDDAS